MVFIGPLLSWRTKMNVKDSRISWSDYWSTQPSSVRNVAMALLAGLLAVYISLGALALGGMWANKLFRADSNWPSAVVLALFSLLGRRFNCLFQVNLVIYLLLCSYETGMLMYYRYVGVMDVSPFQIWYVYAMFTSAMLINWLAFRWLTRNEPPIDRSRRSKGS